jgi:undecaprenol kinase
MNAFSDPITREKPVRYNIFKTFVYATRGIYYGFVSEKNLWFQVIIGLVSALYFLQHGRTSFAIITLVLMLVVGALELMNTAFEHLCDLVDTEYNERIKRIKDVAAGAVLYAALGWGISIVYGVASITFHF